MHMISGQLRAGQTLAEGPVPPTSFEGKILVEMSFIQGNFNTPGRDPPSTLRARETA